MSMTSTERAHGWLRQETPLYLPLWKAFYGSESAEETVETIAI